MFQIHKLIFSIPFIVAFIFFVAARYIFVMTLGILATIIVVAIIVFLSVIVFDVEVDGDVYEEWENQYFPKSCMRAKFVYDHFLKSIEERDRNVWSLGSILMPLSFLIFAWTLVYKIFHIVFYLSLMIASVTVFAFWLTQLVRVNTYNDLAFSQIKRIERTYRFFTHQYYSEWRDKIGILNWTRKGHTFYYVLFLILSVLWIISAYIGPTIINR